MHKHTYYVCIYVCVCVCVCVCVHIGVCAYVCGVYMCVYRWLCVKKLVGMQGTEYKRYKQILLLLGGKGNFLSVASKILWPPDKSRTLRISIPQAFVDKTCYRCRQC